MFLLLTQVLLWIVVILVVYLVLTRWIPAEYRKFLGTAIIAVVILWAFWNPNQPLISSAWAILSFPLKPLGLSLILLILAVRDGAKKVNGTQVLIATIILTLSSVPYLAYQLAERSELEAIQITQLQQQICQTQCPEGTRPPDTAPAIVLLGRGTTQASVPYRPQIQLTDTGDRIFYTAELYRQQVGLGNDPIVIVSAGPRRDIIGTSPVIEGNDIATLLTNLGVPQNRIVVDPRGIDIHTSATSVDRLLRERGISDRRVILVTSGINTRRATLTFNKLGLKVIARPTNFYTIQGGTNPGRNWNVEDFIPSVEGLMITTRVVEEYLSSIYYFLRGWMTPILL